MKALGNASSGRWFQPIQPAGWGRFRLPNHEDLRGRSQRRTQLEGTRERYRWRLVSGLPSTIQAMPEEEKFSPTKRRTIQAGFVKAAVNLARIAPRVLCSRWRSFDIFDGLPTLGDRPVAGSRWRRDQEFARQRLVGVNPLVIRRCTRLPERFGLCSRALEGLLPEGVALEAELEAGRVFVCDYAILDGLTCIDGRFLAAPLVVFHQAPGRSLMPLAIQLGQDPSRHGVFTPASDPIDWLAARTYVQSADGHHHQFVSHLLPFHYEPEPFVIATRRQLHPAHPVHELLAPHLRWLFAINEIARSQAASDSGSFGRMKSTGMVGGNELMREIHAVPFDQRTFLQTLEARGMADRAVLPGYFFRDDALELHAAITRFVRAALARIYPEPTLLQTDGELQAWAAELVDPQRGRVKGLPGGGRIETLDQLECICAELIFRMSAWHTAVSHGQYDHYAHVINAPHGMRRPPPTAPGQMDAAELMAAIPKRVALDQVSASYAAGTEPLHTLLEPREQQWEGAPALMELRATFARELIEISAQIQARNRGLDQAYVALDPRHIGEGVTV